MIESGRQQHRDEVESYLRGKFGGGKWTLTLPRGSGRETYAAWGAEDRLFVKLNTDVVRAVAMAEAGISPAVVDVGKLEDSTVIVVQEWVEGRYPGRIDYEQRLEPVASTISEMHMNEGVRATLPAVSSNSFSGAGLRAVGRVRERWEGVRGQVGEATRLVDEWLDELEMRVGQFRGEGLVASHNDLCWDNWLFQADGRIYIVDLDMMGLDDPALDVGITLWWYYAPELWRRFIGYAWYVDDEGFRERMWARIALHCLSITLPRAGSFDQFDGKGFTERLRDFRAALAGKWNPEMQV
jgi:thiamine kinase-like enzyme